MKVNLHIFNIRVGFRVKPRKLQASPSPSPSALSWKFTPIRVMLQMPWPLFLNFLESLALGLLTCFDSFSVVLQFGVLILPRDGMLGYLKSPLCAAFYMYQLVVLTA